MMKVLQTYRRNLTFVIARDNTGIKTFKFAWVLSVFGVSVFSVILVLVLEARTFQDYSESFYPLSTILVDFFIVIIYVSRKAQIFKLIDELENAIEESEL